jgi:hypothetical protein
MAAAVLANLGHFIIILFSCNSPQQFIEKSLYGKCPHQHKTWQEVGTYGSATTNIVSDLIFVFLPLPSILQHSRMEMRVKMSVVFIFLLGLG